MAIGMHFGRRDLDRMGLFAEMEYLHGKKYSPPITGTQCRDPKGRQMFPGFPKWKSDLQDCYFDTQFKRLFIKEGLNDTYKREMKARMEAKKKNVVQFPFVPPGGTKHHSTPGDNYGTFTGFMPEFSPKLKKELLKKDKKKSTPGNMMTNPGKKGGPGYADICFSPYPAYKSTKYNDPKIKKTPQPAPFIAGSEKEYFDENPYLSTSHKPIYKKENENKYNLYGTFFPSSPAKSLGGGMAGCFDKWPRHVDEKWVPQHRVMKELDKIFTDRMVKYEKKRGRPAKPLINPCLVPATIPKSMPTCSILRKKMKINITPDNWLKVQPVTYTTEYVKINTKYS